MTRALLAFCMLATMTSAHSLGRPVDDKKSDGEVSVPEGKEFKLSKDQITLSKEMDEGGRHTVTVKPADAPTGVKMKAQKWMLGFVPADKKERIEVGRVLDSTALQGMRTEPKAADQPGPWAAEAGDIITHVNGYAVKTVEELICAVNLADDPADIQLIFKDVNDGKQYAFYVSAVKK